MYGALACWLMEGILVVLAIKFHLDRNYLLSIPLALVSICWGIFAFIYTVEWDKEHRDVL
jgi:hypothetical protein